MDLLHASPSPVTGLNITDYNYDLTATARSGRLPFSGVAPFKMTGGAILDSSESINREDSEIGDITDIRIVKMPERKKQEVPVFNYKLK